MLGDLLSLQIFFIIHTKLLYKNICLIIKLFLISYKLALDRLSINTKTLSPISTKKLTFGSEEVKILKIIKSITLFLFNIYFRIC